MCVALPVKTNIYTWDLHAGPHQVLDGSKDNVVSSDTAC